MEEAVVKTEPEELEVEHDELSLNVKQEIDIGPTQLQHPDVFFKLQEMKEEHIDEDIVLSDINSSSPGSLQIDSNSDEEQVDVLQSTNEITAPLDQAEISTKTYSSINVSDDKMHPKKYECKTPGKMFNWKCCSITTYARNEEVNVNINQHDQLDKIVVNKNYQDSVNHTKDGNTRDMFSKCSVCDKIFKGKESLTGHMRIHVKVKSITCSVCNKKFSQSGNLTKHMMIHTGEKPYKCSVCDKKFSHSRTLLIHGRTHTKEKPFKCSVCDKKISLNNSLVVHMRLHTGEKPYKCSVCDKKI